MSGRVALEGLMYCLMRGRVALEALMSTRYKFTNIPGDLKLVSDNGSTQKTPTGHRLSQVVLAGSGLVEEIAELDTRSKNGQYRLKRIDCTMIDRDDREVLNSVMGWLKEFCSQNKVKIYYFMNRECVAGTACKRNSRVTTYAEDRNACVSFIYCTFYLKFDIV